MCWRACKQLKILSQEPLQDAYKVHVAGAREAAKRAIASITFRSSLTDMQIVARHAYALTYEKTYVEEWRDELQKGQWGTVEQAEPGDEPEFLRHK